MAIYRIPYKIEGYAVVIADNEAEAERSFWQFTQAELGAIGVLEAQEPYRDIEAETKDRQKMDDIFREASLG